MISFALCYVSLRYYNHLLILLSAVFLIPFPCCFQSDLAKMQIIFYFPIEKVKGCSAPAEAIPNFWTQQTRRATFRYLENPLTFAFCPCHIIVEVPTVLHEIWGASALRTCGVFQISPLRLWMIFILYSFSERQDLMQASISLVAQTVKNPPTMWETWVWSLGREDTLEEGMATHSSILTWRIPKTEKPGELQSIGLKRVGHDWD